MLGCFICTLLSGCTVKGTDEGITAKTIVQQQSIETFQSDIVTNNIASAQVTTKPQSTEVQISIETLQSATDLELEEEQIDIKDPKTTQPSQAPKPQKTTQPSQAPEPPKTAPPAQDSEEPKSTTIPQPTAEPQVTIAAQPTREPCLIIEPQIMQPPITHVHDFEKYVWELPTCQKGGYYNNICKTCGETECVSQEPLPHEVEDVVVHEGNCMEDTIIEHICKNCGFKVQSDTRYTVYDKHLWISEEVDGEIVEYCERCGVSRQ